MTIQTDDFELDPYPFPHSFAIRADAALATASFDPASSCYVPVDVR